MLDSDYFFIIIMKNFMFWEREKVDILVFKVVFIWDILIFSVYKVYGYFDFGFNIKLIGIVFFSSFLGNI